jgi:hypothetical protein
VKFLHQTQIPRDDGCGVFVLQMLTGMAYEDLANKIDWGDRAVHYTTWVDLCFVLRGLGIAVEDPIGARNWGTIDGIAIVHVEPDHFVLYDAEQGLFYDPAEQQGPTTTTALIPSSYLPIPTPMVLDGFSSVDLDRTG